MRKSFTILIALVLAFFTVPFSGITAFAEKVDSVNPEKAYEIEYKILHEDGEGASVADGFFKKPGILLEYEGKKYIQLTVTSPEMIQSLSNEYGDYVLVNKDEESMTLQLKVNNDLSNMELDMHIVVPSGAIPGFPGYDQKHGAILNFDTNSKKEVDAKEHSLTTSENKNGPSIEETESTEPEDEDEGSGENESDQTIELELSAGSYTFDVSYLRSDNDDSSSMGNYLGDTVFVDVKNGKTEVTISITDKESVTKLQLDGKDPVEVVEDAEGRYERFLLDSLFDSIDAFVEYQAPFGDDIYKGNATFRVSLNIDSKESVESKDKPGNGLLPTPKEEELSLKDGLYTANVIYYHADENKGSAMARYLGDKVSIAVEKDEVEISVTVNDNESVTLLEIEGNKPLGVVKDGKKNYETFKVDHLKNVYKGFTKYQTPYEGTIFEGEADFRIIIDQESIEKLSEEKELKVPLGEKVPVEKNSTLVIDSSKGTDIKLPSNLPDDVQLTVKEVAKIDKTDGLEKIGDVLDFNFTGLKDEDYNFELTMYFDADKYNPEEYDIAIYYFDEEKGEWIVQDSKVGQGKVSLTVNHFSTYGLFAKKKEEPKPEPEKEDEKEGQKEDEKVSLTPDKVYEVAYEILQEDGSGPSVADGFFVKPGHILEKDGVKYIQIKVTDGEYVKALSNEFGDAIIVKENKDGSVVLQLKLKDDLSDMILDMHIVVGAGAMPGFPGYDAKHKAILSIDSASLEEIDTADHLLAGTGDEKNENGPFLKDQPKPDPEKPELDDETDEEETDETDETPKKDDDEKNPQTGVKTNFLLYTFLLISSLIPLALQLRRRFV